MSRRVVRDRSVDQKSAVKLFSEDAQPRVLGRNTSNITTTEPRLIKGLSRVPFDQLSAIRIDVRRAVGLPVLTTASRVTARLLDHDLSQMGDCSPSYISQPDSEATSPVYNLNAGWRGNEELHAKYDSFHH